MKRNAQSSPSPEDSSAIRAPVTNYCEAYFTGDARRMEQTLHPHYLKHMIHGAMPVREKTGPQMVEEVRKNGPADLPAVRKMEEVTILDVAGVIASAKMVTPGWTDYLTLSKVDGQVEDLVGSPENERLDEAFPIAAHKSLARTSNSSDIWAWGGPEVRTHEEMPFSV